MKDDWDKRFGVDGFIAAVKRDDNTSYFSTLLDNALERANVGRHEKEPKVREKPLITRN